MATNLARANPITSRESPGPAPEKTRRRVSLAVVRIKSQRQTVRFFALDASVRVAVEADSEDEARDLCRAMQWDFIGLCET
jgi:hypothetical protein